MPHINKNKKITGQTGNDGTKNVKIMITLKYEVTNPNPNIKIWGD